MKRKLSILTTIVILLLVGCPATPPVCQCPNGTEHYEDEECCESTDCACTFIPRVCECDPKEHYLPCTCGLEECDCVVLPRGYITDTLWWNDFTFNVPIYQKADITDEAAATATSNIITGFSGLSDASKNKLADATNFKAVWIVEDMEYDFDAENGIVKIGDKLSADDVRSVLTYIVLPKLVGKFFIRYNNGSTGSVISDDHDANSSINLRTISSLGWTRDGYTFAGWATTPTGTVEYADGANYVTGSSFASIYFYTVWQ